MDLESLAQQIFTISRRSGPEDIMVVCPFHRGRDGNPEREGSMAFHLETGRWYCHRCGEGGGLRSLLKQMGLTEDGTYDELLEELKDRQPIRYASPVWYGETPPESHLPDHYVGLFDGRISKQMLEWGFSRTTIRRFEVGYDERNLRIPFPLRDYRGNLLGFSGRTLGSARSKYKVYAEPEYESWGLPPHAPAEKGMIVWNYDRVYPASLYDYQADYLVVEGFKACMWLWQLGFRRTVALLGSSMTETQQALLERLGGRLYLFLDNDEAGQKKHKIGLRLRDGGANVYIPEYPGKQPDTLTKELVLQAKQSCFPV